jgi:hypothetical protein
MVRQWDGWLADLAADRAAMPTPRCSGALGPLNVDDEFGGNESVYERQISVHVPRAKEATVQLVGQAPPADGEAGAEHRVVLRTDQGQDEGLAQVRDGLALTARSLTALQRRSNGSLTALQRLSAAQVLEAYLPLWRGHTPQTLKHEMFLKSNPDAGVQVGSPSSGSLTALQRLSHGSLTALQRLSHGSLTALQRLSNGSLTALHRAPRSAWSTSATSGW